MSVPTLRSTTCPIFRFHLEIAGRILKVVTILSDDHDTAGQGCQFFACLDSPVVQSMSPRLLVVARSRVHEVALLSMPKMLGLIMKDEHHAPRVLCKTRVCFRPPLSPTNRRTWSLSVRLRWSRKLCSTYPSALSPPAGADVGSQAANDATSDAMGRPLSAWSSAAGAGATGAIASVITLAMGQCW